ncbi:low temperature requirement protein A [Kitasatospora sp. DSM 101779]|uniref:low temperature requirement protein A n=1 Tax=Kitasatospora sp. DSM 101779 TaxID=2853165 RepID=UPI0021D91066|nr:low temperature requirement protein A [Kitasatospora sp. DSM 101779]MCU7823487.1 low temperature requirement protein A [Kitasatospora sp. DSM 101779]
MTTATGTTAVEGEAELRVGPLELFFDLVFVFTVTQLTASLVHHLTPGGLVRVLVMLAVIWWMYDAFIWLTNALPPSTHPRRAFLLLGMTGFLVVSLAVPHAFDGSGAAFGWAYLLVIAVHTGMFASAGVARGPVLRMGGLNLAIAALVVVGGYLQGSAQLALWTASLALQIANPYLVDLPQFHLRADHFVERHGLVVIVAFGESVVALGVGAAGHQELTTGPVSAAVCALAVCVGLWWAYFGHDDDERTVAAMAELDDARRNRVAIRVHNLGHYALLLAVILFAAGAESAVAHPTAALPAARAAVLAAGPALFLVANAGIRRTFGLHPLLPRLVAAALVAATVPLGTGRSALAQLGAIAALMAAAFVWEELQRPGLD